MRVAFAFVLAAALVCEAQDHVVRPSNTTESLRGLSTPSAKVAWASGTHGTYLRSTDGGRTWHSAQVPGAEELDFRDVEAFSAREAVLLSSGDGDRSRIYRTRDAGQHWELQFTAGPKGFLDCMAFWDREHGIALGDPIDGVFQVLITQDSGRHWNLVPAKSLPPAAAGEGAFAASGSCIAVQGKANAWFATGGKAARVFHTADQGQTWTATATRFMRGTDSSGIFSIAFRDARHGVAAGGDYKHPGEGGANLAFTDDGGASWTLSPIVPQYYFSAVAFDPQQDRVLVVGPTRSAYADSLKKRAWRISWAQDLNAASFRAPGKALAVGAKGTIVEFISEP